MLREELLITSPKAGCQQGGCGACTVLVDGEPRRVCLLPLAAVEGASVTTVEGLGAPDELSAVQAAFDEHYAAQCGFCTSGFLMAAQALVERGEELLAARDHRGAERPRLPLHRLREDRRRRQAAANGDARRRTTEADMGPQAGGRRHARPREPGMKAVGARLPRYDGLAHVTGRTQYVDDVRVHGTLWTKALRSPHHHAGIVSLDTERGRGAARRARGRHARGRPEERLRAPRGARRARRRAAAGRGLRALEGPADRRRGRRVRGDRARRRGRHRGRRTRSATAVLRHPHGRRPRTRRRSTSGARSIRTSARTTTAGSARATSTGRSRRPTRSSRASTARRRSSTRRWRRRSRWSCPRPTAG